VSRASGNFGEPICSRSTGTLLQFPGRAEVGVRVIEVQGLWKRLGVSGNREVYSSFKKIIVNNLTLGSIV